MIADILDGFYDKYRIIILAALGIACFVLHWNPALPAMVFTFGKEL